MNQPSPDGAMDATRCFRCSRYPFLILVVLAWVGFGSFPVRAAWPPRVFAPYVYLGAGDGFKLTECDDACGQKFFTIAFVIADPQGNPAWDGRFATAQNSYADQIGRIRQRGGDVIASFGGEAGTELAMAETNAAALAGKYQGVIDRYHFSWLDFDIEGEALAQSAANERRNVVLAKLQAKNPGLRVSYTLPVDPDGISSQSRSLLTDAKARGVKVYSANVMTMDFGAHFTKNKSMSAVAIASALRAHDQCAAIEPAMAIGLTPMIGRNDQRGEVFTLEDAQALMRWARTQPWICSVSFWASNRDAGKAGPQNDDNTFSGIDQKPWAFTLVFQGFSTGH